MDTDPAGDHPTLTDGDEVLEDLDAEQVEDLDADEATEDVFGGEGYAYTSSCQTR